MARTVGIGLQNFEEVVGNNCFYIDKTAFIKDWWESKDKVTLITRPRRFGKTLNMSMLEHFFSVKYKNRGDLFEGLSIWQDEEYRKIQGTYPVIFLSFADVKDTSFPNARRSICRCIEHLYNQNEYLLGGKFLNDKEKAFCREVCADMPNDVAANSLKYLADIMCRYYGKNAIILLDEYDTPMQEAYLGGYWDEMTAFMRSFFNSTFKTNPFLERGVMTGITRVSKESMFSDLNNLRVVTTTSDMYATAFGFTEDEVFAALDECGLGDEKETVKYWFDGFVFGKHEDIYNPWSIINFLSTGEYDAYWANTSSNSLAGKLIREGEPEVKEIMEKLLNGETFHATIDEQIVFNQLDHSTDAIWSLLLAGGYLRVEHFEFNLESREKEYDLKLTNEEVHMMFEQMIKGWFSGCRKNYNAFIKGLISGDTDSMNEYMNQVTQQMFSYFDMGKKTSKTQPERFYHGFVLGLVVGLSKEYIITSNKESGFGRYDVVIEPKDKKKDAFILEFKVFNPKKESSLEETVKAAHAQIDEKRYEADLVARGFDSERIRKYGFAFEGKEVLIG